MMKAIGMRTRKEFPKQSNEFQKRFISDPLINPMQTVPLSTIRLTMEVTDGEIVKVMKQINLLKAPRSDGAQAIFYHKS